MRDTRGMEAANMKIKNIEIKSAAVEIKAMHDHLGCDACDDEPSEIHLRIKSENVSFDHVLGPYCAEKYLRALA